MTYYCADVKKFHDKFELTTPVVFKFLPEDVHVFRLKFLNEEFTELHDSHNAKDLAGAIDALIDLVYITCGCALLHGVTPREFVSHAESFDSVNIYEPANDDITFSGPHLLSDNKQAELVAALRRSIDNYEAAWLARDERALRTAFAEIYVNCLFGAGDMGFTENMWNTLWDDVQRANMSKVRAKSAAESKRGSAWDVVKPAGWIGPRTEELVASFVNAFGESK